MMIVLRRLWPLFCAVPLSVVAGCGAASEGAAAEDAAADDSAAADTAPDGGPANRLARENSPYLLLLAHNPVDWYPWGPEAFEKARKENKPIFLSIGYSSCFWCHVMERQVFSNEEIAAFMNEHFVNVKVDREERPEIDDLYMLALQVYLQAAGSSQSGGWPLSMFLTPDGKPLAGGTYFPPEDREGMPGFPTILNRVHDLWTERREDVKKSADVLAQEVRRLARTPLALKPVPLSEELVTATVAELQSSFDPEYGGLDFDAQHPDSPKFPVPPRLSLMQSRIRQDADNPLAAMVDLTLEQMAAGGIYDHLGGGFHRYSTDRRWLVPHFEKMLYDNTQLAEVYVDAFRRTSRKAYQRVAEGTFDFLLREMRHPEGGFYSALDAETDGVEGKFYVWSKAEIDQLLDAADAHLFEEAYGLNREQTFEPGHVLHMPRSLGELADGLEMPVAELDHRLTQIRAKLLEARGRRQPLLRDDKVLMSWNGLAIRAFAQGGQSLQRPEYTRAAQDAAMFVLQHMRDKEGRLLHSWRNGRAQFLGYLDDYAFLVDGLLALHETTGDEKWLNASRRLTDDQISLFWDEQGKGFFFTSPQHEELIARTKSAYDSVMPSGNSVSVQNLVRLARLTGEDRYENYARETLQTFAPQLQQSPGNVAYMAQSLADYLAAFGPGGQSPGAPGGNLFADPSPPRPSASSPSPPPTEKAAPLVAVAIASPDDAKKHDKLTAKAYLSCDRLPAGETCRVAVVIDVIEGWHINANPATPDFVTPTELVLDARLKTTLEGVAYPKGEAFTVEGVDEPLSVYEKRVILYGTLRVPPSAAAGRENLEFHLQYQACNDKTCILAKNLKLQGDVPVAKLGELVNPANEKLFERPQ